MMSNFFCFPPKALQNNGSHLKMFPPKPQKISASTARLLGCFSMSGHPPINVEVVLSPYIDNRPFAASLTLLSILKLKIRDSFAHSRLISSHSFYWGSFISPTGITNVFQCYIVGH